MSMPVPSQDTAMLHPYPHLDRTFALTAWQALCRSNSAKFQARREALIRLVEMPRVRWVLLVLSDRRGREYFFLLVNMAALGERTII